ncbi:MAG: hypothetical protein IPJ20_17420 [Flammeovirgaceae bacterium]|nr:hypothetical protein [Flammeovirgaceae bacterium]
MILRNLIVLIAFVSMGLPSQAQSLSTKNKKAIELYKRKIDKASLWKTQATYSIANKNTVGKFIIEPLSEIVNQYPMQYFPVVTGDGAQLIFTAALEVPEMIMRI